MRAATDNSGNEALEAVPQAQGGWRMHPAVLLVAWMVVAVVIQWLHAVPLLLAGVALMSVALKRSPARLGTLLSRTRWVMLSLLLIYGYATPGVSLWEPLGTFSPTLEGLSDGLLQLSRLVFALAALSIVLSLLHRSQLIAGLYALAYPLRYVGLSRERLAVRLALTLHYAESAMQPTAADWRSRLEGMLAPVAAEQHAIELHTPPLTWRDGVLLACLVTVLVASLL